MDDTMKENNNGFINEIVFDLSAIIDFIFDSDKKSKTSEIREVWDGTGGSNLQMIQKTMAEVKSDELSAIANIRYDLLKLLINEVNSISVLNIGDSEGDIDPEELDENSVYVGEPFVETFGQMLALNTLQKEGIIINNTKTAKND